MKRTLYLIFIFLVISCGSSSGDKPKSDEQKADEKITQGETALTSGQIDDAITAFAEALVLDSTNSEAYAGLGWALIFSDDNQQAIEILEAGLAIDTTEVEIYSALAFLYNTLGDTSSIQQSNAFIASVLSLDNNWISSYGFDFAVNDIYALLAQNHFLLGNYTESLDAIRQLDSTFNADVTTEAGRQQLSAKIESYNVGFTKK